MPFKERDVRKMVTEVETTSWRLRECIRVRELAVTHRLERIRRLRMLEEQEAWKREAGFDCIKIIAEMDTQRFRADFDLNSLYSKLYNPRWPHTPAEYTLEMNGDIERLRMEILPSQPVPPPQCYPSPRRSPAVGTGLDEPGLPRAETQSREGEGTFPLSSQYRWLHKPGPGGYRYFASSRHRGGRSRNNNYFRTSRCSRGVCETTEEAAAAKGESMG